MSIEINNETSFQVDEPGLHRMAVFALDALRVHPDAEVNILLYEVGPMEELHLKWLDEPGPTDVLSFPMDQLRPGTDEFQTPAGLLGDIVLCPSVAEAQAITAGHPLQDELNMLLTHGMLHLLGFDHAEPDEEREMFGIQHDILMGFVTAERTRES